MCLLCSKRPQQVRRLDGSDECVTRQGIDVKRCQTTLSLNLGLGACGQSGSRNDEEQVGSASACCRADLAVNMINVQA